jgi:hypothetical protein
VSAATIIQRIEAALEKMRWRRMEVRAIYLTAEDHDDFDLAMAAEMTKALGRRVRGSFLAFREHHIRRGETSAIYSTHGLAVVIPKRLSRRTAERKAA